MSFMPFESIVINYASLHRNLAITMFASDAYKKDKDKLEEFLGNANDIHFNITLACKVPTTLPTKMY